MKPKNKRRNNNYGQKNAADVSPESSKQGANLVYGVLPVLELLRAENRKIEKIYVSEGIRSTRIAEIIGLARERSIRVEKTSKGDFSRNLDENANHQGVIAFTAAASYYDPDKLFGEIVGKENSLCLILDGIEDPRNLGAVLRTAEGAGVDGVFIPERRAVGLTDTVAKSSAGAAEYVKVAKVKNVNKLIDELKAHEVWVAGTSGEASMDYVEWDWRQSTALVLGREGKGLHRLTAEKCDILVSIPMHGKIESLNVSVAAGVVLFEATRQRGKK